MFHMYFGGSCLLLALTPACATSLAPSHFLSTQAQTRVTAHILEQLPAALREQASITVHIKAPRGVAQRPCSSTWSWGEIDASQWQRIHLPVRCDGQSGSVVAQAQVQVLLHTPRQDLPKGHVLRQEDMQVRAHHIRSAAAALTPHDWLGMQLRRAVVQGQPLQHNDVLRPLYARKGERVEIRAGEGNVVVSAHGIALRNGHAGEVIRARNIHSHTWVEGVLIAPQVLQAHTLQPGSGVKVQSGD